MTRLAAGHAVGERGQAGVSIVTIVTCSVRLCILARLVGAMGSHLGMPNCPGLSGFDRDHDPTGRAPSPTHLIQRCNVSSRNPHD